MKPHHKSLVGGLVVLVLLAAVVVMWPHG